MRTTPEIQAKLRERLQAAKERAGSAEKLGKLLGWANGGYVRQFLSDNEKTRRAITQELVIRANESPEPWLHAWFDGILPPIAKVDIAQAQVARAAKAAWPFTRMSQAQWESMNPLQQAIVEDAAVSKARELLQERASATRGLTSTNLPRGRRSGNAKTGTDS